MDNGTQIEARFPHCLAFETTAEVKIIDQKTKEVRATVILRPLSHGEVLDHTAERTIDLMYLSIVSWDLKNKEGEVLPINKETVRNLSADIGAGLLAAFYRLNFVSQAEQENLSRP